MNPRAGIMGAVALGAALVAKKLWKKKQAGGFGLRESYSKRSEWTPEATAP